ncbi:hypothetical protein ACLQ24_12040 [Micromonospora sp. DT4]|uniref:hypothetical protein n=1 Tax=Micromonospora sp. DT4 TaxID=3393438 RepID=UPI003CEDFCC7
MTQTVVVTGASAGVGRAVACAYAARTGARRASPGDRARRRSAALWVGTHKPALSGLALAGVAVALTTVARRLR